MRRPSLCSISPYLIAASLLLAGCADEPAPEVVDDVIATPTDAATTAEPTSAPSGDPTPSEPAATPSATETATEDVDVCSGRETEAFIEVLTPAPDETVADGFTVTGCGNTFEAAYQYRVELADGTVATEGFGTMSCGNGCVGEFEETITVGETGPVTLVVFETSAQDGSEVNVVEVPLTIG